MKAGWKTKKLGELVSFQKVQHKGKKPLPYVGMEDISSGTGEFLGNEEPKQVLGGSFLFNDQHVLYGRLRPYLNKVLLPNFEGHCSTEVFPIAPSGELDRRFLFHWLTQSSTADLIDATCTGARMPRANMNAVLEFDFSYPIRSEQQRIVTILDEAFEGIAAATANAEKNLSNAREVFDSHLKLLFTDGSTGWEMHPLKNMASTFGRGKSRHRPRNEPKLYGGNFPFIQTGDIRNCDHFITEYTQTYSEAGLAQSKLWPKGTLCITIAANIAETGILTFDSCFPDSVIGFVADPEKSDVHFVEYLLGSFKARLQAKGKGSAQDNLNLASFENELFPFPSVKQQKTIAAELDELSAQVVSLESVYQQKLDALAELKKSILHQAFTGQLH